VLMLDVLSSSPLMQRCLVSVGTFIRTQTYMCVSVHFLKLALMLRVLSSSPLMQRCLVSVGTFIRTQTYMCVSVHFLKLALMLRVLSSSPLMQRCLVSVGTFVRTHTDMCVSVHCLERHAHHVARPELIPPHATLPGGCWNFRTYTYRHVRECALFRASCASCCAS